MNYKWEFGFQIEQELYFRLLPKQTGKFWLKKKIKPWLILLVSVFVFYGSDSDFLTLSIKCIECIDLVREMHYSQFISLKDKANYLELLVMKYRRNTFCDYWRTQSLAKNEISSRDHYFQDILTSRRHIFVIRILGQLPTSSESRKCFLGHFWTNILQYDNASNPHRAWDVRLTIQKAQTKIISDLNYFLQSFEHYRKLFILPWLSCNTYTISYG